MTHRRSVALLLNFAAAISLFWGAAAQAENPSADLGAAVGQLGQAKAGAETDKAVAALAKQGDDTVAEIERQSEKRNADFGWRHAAVLVLKAVNSGQSRDLLWRLAIGDLSEGRLDNEQRWAADALIACDSKEAWTLLSSSEPMVLTSALNAVEGEALDQERMNSLRKCFRIEDALVSRRAAAVMAGDPTGKFGVEVVGIIGDALVAASEIPDIDATDPPARCCDIGISLRETYYFNYAQALAKVRVDDQALHQLAARLKRRPRDAVILALAQRGDKSVHEEIVKLAQDPKAEMFRKSAVDTLRDVGTPDDLPLLRKLAQSDPLERKRSSGLLDESQNRWYPVRQAAKDAISQLEQKFKE